MKKIIVRLVVGITALAASVAIASPASASASATSNPTTVGIFVDAVNYEAARYGVGPISIYVGDLGDGGTVAQTGSYGITLNSRYAAMSPEEFDSRLGEDIASGYQPGGCEPIRAVAIHEVGHLVDRSTGAVTRLRVARATAAGLVGSNFHGYAFHEDGSFNLGEAIAVSFQAVECGSATQSEQQVYNLLVR